MCTILLWGENRNLPSHFGLLVLFSMFVSLVFAVLMRENPREQLRLGGTLLASFVLAAIVLGWMMYAVPW